jgi:hypothetical protein
MCVSCGLPVARGAHFCRSCGAEQLHKIDETPGAALASSQRACVVCGRGVDGHGSLCDQCTRLGAASASGPSLPPVHSVAPGPTQQHGPEKGQRRAGWALIVGVLAVGAICLAAAYLLVLKSKDTQPTATEPTRSLAEGTSGPETVVDAPEPDAGAVARPETPAAAGRQAPAKRVGVNATITRTCGASGTDDCYVSLRSRPTASSRELGRLDESATVRVVCQLSGGEATSSVLGRTSRIWSRTREGAYLTNVYLTGRGLDPFRTTLRACR